MNPYQQTKKSHKLEGRELHIHVDAMVHPSKHFEGVLIEELKFKEHHFEHNTDPSGSKRPHYEPQAHFSAYPKDMVEFRSLWQRAWLFEERIIRHALLGIDSSALPPVVDQIVQVNSK